MQYPRLSHLLVLLAVGVLSACEKVPLTSPTGSTITLSIDKTSVPIGGTAQLIAVVVEASGTAPQNGTMVTFNSAFGTITPQEAPTSGGIARATFTGTASGVAKVGAFSGAAKATEVELKVGGAAVERVAVRTEPTTVPSTGGTVAVITFVSDSAGNPLPGLPITFSSDSGTLSSGSAVTDANGEARISLTANRTTKITVTGAPGKTGEVTVNALAMPTVTLTACTTAPAVGVPVTCTVNAAAASGAGVTSTPLANVTINWGDGTGELPLGNVTGATAVTHTYSAPGTYTVTAAATDQASQRATTSTTLNVTRVLPAVTLTVPATGAAGVPIAMSIAPPATSATTQPITSVVVDFGDGTSRTFANINATIGFTKTYGSEGGYTVTATATDASGQQGRTSSAIVITRSAPTITTFSQTSNTTPPAVVGTPETFNIVVSAATGLSIRQVTVTLERTGQELYNQAGGGTFATDRVLAGDILTLRVSDSAGNVAQTQLVVQ